MLYSIAFDNTQLYDYRDSPRHEGHDVGEGGDGDWDSGVFEGGADSLVQRDVGPRVLILK